MNIVTTLARRPSQNAEQLRENGWLRCGRKPQSFKTYDSSETGVWSLRKSQVYVHDTTLRSQNAEQLRENGWLRCGRVCHSAPRFCCAKAGEKTWHAILRAQRCDSL